MSVKDCWQALELTATSRRELLLAGRQLLRLRAAIWQVLNHAAAPARAAAAACALLPAPWRGQRKQGPAQARTL